MSISTDHFSKKWQMRKDVFITQDNDTAHTNEQFLLPPSNAFGEPVIHNWPPNSPHLKLHDYIPVQPAERQDFCQNLCMWTKWKKDIPVTMNISQELGCLLLQNVLTRYELECRGKSFRKFIYLFIFFFALL